MYVYIRSEANLWTTGFYDPSGKWHTDDDFGSKEEARQRVHWLNGGQDILPALEDIKEMLKKIKSQIAIYS